MTSPDLAFRLDGPADGPPLILGPSVGTTSAVWDPQIPALARRFRVARFELPGHGGTPPLPAGSTVEDLAHLVLRLADSLEWQRFHYAGISLGGAVGSTLALIAPERVGCLALVCTTARFGDPQQWRDRAAFVRAEGTASLVEPTLARWFADPETARSALGARLVEDLTTVDTAGYAACCDALSTFDIRDRLADIQAPTLVVAGRADPATPPAHARELVDGIPNANLAEISGAAHLAGVDRPEAVTAALLAFLDDTGSAGMRVRREVLGDEHVDRAVAATTPFTAAFQDLITRYAWGEIWTRPGLDRRTRSCITLMAMVALGHHDELAMHVRAALRNGLTREEIGEVLLQSAIYCGVPAANAAFAVAQRVLG
ncbi:bifunctional 3-oxoadipate enol-lactonase/4-carboxymuconolactone decarboxylase PcaDC [Actinokineospora diospyrosa]|uniref:3-oxoadipate enol-lactonase / 4-carboxymuconolactone decarboxylase n=2 Tax=Actinokineospora diospyrosa TaxID=103728 RepID=A0ABT1IFU5_9PSEU|nr:3-oxoadipate enol-lactonase / 4-carboxymuconolactone decarboxylase [Actinokineospora diospyrosa]